MTVTTGERASSFSSAWPASSGIASTGAADTSSATETLRPGTSNSLARTSTSSSLSDWVMVFISPSLMSSLMTSVEDLPIFWAKSVTVTPCGTITSSAAGSPGSPAAAGTTGAAGSDPLGAGGADVPAPGAAPAGALAGGDPCSLAEPFGGSGAVGAAVRADPLTISRSFAASESSMVDAWLRPSTPSLVSMSTASFDANPSSFAI